ncbi:hypothetical protein IGS67_11205 [Flavimobilis sp. GY10621]|uniref:DUF7824 domain-containing protein n=1 Tax=Flavimobilis rhizosphaerae TaxID=2775421 RepID=A0ABR9DSF5_9MICO|nr:DUF6493 family protein [Flavimobilis rhizosphaerae]MBD9700052.1 hypothetical protein [Flavimobilis rhizosphaerae]
MTAETVSPVPLELAHAPAAKVARVLRELWTVDDDAVLPVLAERGPAFAEQLVRELARNRNRFGPGDPTPHSALTLRLLATLDAPLVDHAPHVEDWALHTRSVLERLADPGTRTEPWTVFDSSLEPSVVLRHVPAHVRAAAEHGIPATAGIALIVPELLARGELDRDDTVEAALMALDTVGRPSDRAAWTTLLRENLAFSDDEVRAVGDRLVPVLGHGETPVVEAFAPALLASTDDALVGDVLATTLHVRAAKTRRVVLAAALERPAPSDPEVLALVAALVAPHLTSTDRGVQKAASALVERWGLEVTTEDEPAPQPVVGRWNATPPAWTLPRFEPVEPTARALEALVAEVARGAERPVDIVWEQLLEAMNAVAAADREGARSALAGVPHGSGESFRMVAVHVETWLRGRRPLEHELDRRFQARDLVQARDAHVVHRLGDLPCLLSTPSHVDLSIVASDLVERLESYGRAGAGASEGDLQLALARLDLTSVDSSVRERLARLAAHSVPLLDERGIPCARDAVAVALGYLDDPYVLRDASADTARSSRPAEQDVTIPASLSDLPQRAHAGWLVPDVTAFPTWTQMPVDRVVPAGTPGSGLALAQAARRRAPLPRAVATALLVEPSTLLPVAVTDGARAVRDAWSRGLLPPGAADASLPWRGTTPTRVAALAASLLAAADDGAAAAVWPFADDLLARFAALPRIPVGTAELVGTLAALVPDALDAVSRGIAPAKVLEAPGLRAIADRTGSSQAVTAAQAAVALLPAVDDSTSEPSASASSASAGAASPGTMSTGPTRARSAGAARAGRSAPALPAPADLLDDDAFASAWPSGLGTSPEIDDGATLGAAVVAVGAHRLCSLDLTFPDLGTFRVSKTWFYDLEVEGQCEAEPWADGAPPPVSRRRTSQWLFWDASGGKIAVSPVRNRLGGSEGPLGRAARTPLTVSMVAVLLAAACSEPAAPYYLTSSLRSGGVGASAVRSAVQRLLPLEDVNPGLLLRLLAYEPELLPVLWPLLTETVQHAATRPSPPRWLPRVLDAATIHAPALRTAAYRGLLPPDAAAWPGLLDLAERKGSRVAFRKSAALAAFLGLTAPGGAA